MAAPYNSKGYQCKFIDSVPNICVCKKCSLVARRLTVTSCCGESFCHACISGPKEEGKPCPECGEETITIYDQVKYQRQINNLKVYCSLKERGCVWSGKLEQLEAHLDPDLDNCQCVDTKCPLNCQQTIPKNKVEQHVTKECVRRDYTCQHCNFKATYEEVVGTHLAECSYVPLQCPNMCGVTCEREVMEDHMSICRLEEVACEFREVGCEERPKREDQEEHARYDSQKHLTLTATATTKINKELDSKIANKIHDLEVQFLLKFEQQEQLFQKKSEEQQQCLQLQVETLSTKLKEQHQKNEYLEQELLAFRKQHSKTNESMKTAIMDVRQRLPEFKNSIEIKCFNQVLRRSFINWKSSPMYTHIHGYRFIVELRIKRHVSMGIIMAVSFSAVKGVFDAHLSWPKAISLEYAFLNSDGNELHRGKWAGELSEYNSKDITPGWSGPPGIPITNRCTERDIPVLLLENLPDDKLCFEVLNIVT